ncbi:MAG: rod shape-determining protein [Muribaculaceae bacterium]|nr:rod shape-determining protein [Muribaculaceae bacterium]
MEKKHIVALEIGSSKIRGAVGIYNPATGDITVKAVEEEKLVDCVRYGCIQNVAEVTNRVRAIIKRLDALDHTRRIKGVYVAIGGRSVTASSATFERRFAADAEITRDVVKSLFDEARSTLYNERDVIDVTPREFRVDNAVVSQPVGTIGHSIQAVLNMVTARPQIKRNIYSVVQDRLQLDINGCIVRQIAQANVVLNMEDMRLGCMLVDFGAETTTVSIYRNGTLQYLATLPIGSRNITRDITTLNHLEETAEKLKTHGGNALSNNVSAAFGAYDSTGDYVEMNNYVSARAGEIIANIHQQIKYANLTADKIPSGIIIVGNGARMKGFNELLAETLGMRVRTGIPQNVNIENPGIHISEAVDVIAILHAAATRGAKDCTEEINDIDTITDSTTEQGDQSTNKSGEQIGVKPHIITETDTTHNPKPNPGRKYWDRIRERMLSIMSDDEDNFAPDEEDDN